MKMSLSSLLLLTAGLASAQFGADRRDDRQDVRSRFDGLYSSVQRDGTIRRTLRLERDGDAELVTELRDRGYDRDRDRRGNGARLSDRDKDRYGLVAARAAEGRPVRHRGRWEFRDGKLVVRLTDLNPDVKGGNRVDLPMEREGGALVTHRDTDLYGKEKVSFTRDGGWDGGRPGGWNDNRRDYGYMQWDRDKLRVDGIELFEGRDSDSRLVIRTESRRIEIRGEVRRRGDDVVLRTADGDYTLRMRSGSVESIRGNGIVDRHRVSFMRD